MIQGKWTAFT